MLLPDDLLLACMQAGMLLQITPPHQPLPSTGDDLFDQVLAHLRLRISTPEMHPDMALATSQLRQLVTGGWMGPLVYIIVEGGELQTETLCERHARALALREGLLVEPAYHLAPEPLCQRCEGGNDATGAAMQDGPVGRLVRGALVRVSAPAHRLHDRQVAVIMALPLEAGDCVRYTVQPVDGDEYDRELARHSELVPAAGAQGTVECMPCPCGSGVDWSQCPGPAEG